LPRSSHYKFIKRYGDGTWSLKKNTRTSNESVFHNDKEVVPVEEIEDLLEKLWLDPFYMQTTSRRFYSRIAQQYEGISLSKIAKFLDSKRTSQIFKKTAKSEVTPINSKKPRAMYQLDFIDLKKSQHANLNNRYLLNIVDHFSKYAWSYPLPHRDSDLAAGKVRELFSLGHVPTALKGDGEFKNVELMKVCEEYEVKFLRSEPKNPRTNGLVERFNRTLKTAISQLWKEYDDLTFLDALYKLMSNYNNTVHSSHKFTPRQVYYGNEEVISQAYENLTKYRKEGFGEALPKTQTW
jgi:hypothetical protein